MFMLIICTAYTILGSLLAVIYILVNIIDKSVYNSRVSLFKVLFSTEGYVAGECSFSVLHHLKNILQMTNDFRLVLETKINLVFGHLIVRYDCCRLHYVFWIIHEVCLKKMCLFLSFL